MMSEFTRIMAVDAVTHFKKNFAAGGFIDENLEPWEKRKSKKNDEGRAILVGSTPGGSNLKDSIRVGQVTSESVTIIAGEDAIPYAKIHNEGLFGLAFGKYRFKMPKRKFMGFSGRLKRNLLNKIKTRISKIFK